MAWHQRVVYRSGVNKGQRSRRNDVEETNRSLIMQGIVNNGEDLGLYF